MAHAKSRRPIALIATVAFLGLGAMYTAAAIAEPTADAQFTSAKLRAQKEHKHVLLLFTASWCGGCKQFEQFFADPLMKAIIEKAFVVLPIDIGEEVMIGHKRPSTPGAMEFRAERGITGALELPFLIMTDADGRTIVTSELNGKRGANVGYPTSAQEIDWYVEMLRRAAPGLSKQDLAATQKWLDDHSPYAPLARDQAKH